MTAAVETPDTRCAEPGCDRFGDHMDADGGEWCAEHCPDHLTETSSTT